MKDMHVSVEILKLMISGSVKMLKSMILGCAKMLKSMTSEEPHIGGLRGIIMIQNAREGGMVVPFVKLRIRKTDIEMKLWNIKNGMAYPKN